MPNIKMKTQRQNPKSHSLWKAQQNPIRIYIWKDIPHPQAVRGEKKEKYMNKYKKPPKFLDFVFCSFLNHKYFIGNKKLDEKAKYSINLS